MKKKLAKFVRVATIPPIAAVMMILFLPEIFAGAARRRAIFFLAVLPMLAYPVCWVIPPLRRRGREAERTLAVVFSLLGYLGGAACAVLLDEPRDVLLIYLVYLASGALIAVFSFLLRVKGSGHASGVAGPVVMMVIRQGPVFLSGFAALALVFWSSLTLGRHTWPQLVLGSMFPIVSMAILMPVL